jgi:hypothetical protein
MFASIVSKVVTIVRSTIRAVGVMVQRSPWTAAAAILAMFLLM